MDIQNKIRLVKERIYFLNKLNMLRRMFLSPGPLRIVDGVETHVYKEYFGTKVYLALTCFDILGQPDDWCDFGKWMCSKSKKVERDAIILKFIGEEDERKIQSIYSEYNQIYGVKKAFYRFLREIISDENRKKILDSIKVSKRIKEMQFHPDGSHTPDVGEFIEVDDNFKEDFLFKIRNNFTHKGITVGSAASGIFYNLEAPLHVHFPSIPASQWPSVTIFQEMHKGDLLSFQIQRWPYVLMEVINDTITSLSEAKL